jgi:SAM-dependent methyltransferase
MSDSPAFENRRRAESFGSLAEVYERARPSYPAAMIDSLLRPGARSVLDVGCGTGKAGELFAGRGCAVLGVEVDPRMAEIARTKGVEVEVSRFELWDPGERRFDLVISGQAWHWIDPRAGSAKAAAVLDDQGRIGLFWNVGNPPAQVRDRLAPVYARFAPQLENYSLVLGNRRGRLEETLAGLGESGMFAPAEVRSFSWRETYLTADWLDFLSTHSDHQTLEPGRRDRLLAAVGEAIDEIGGSFEVAYETVLVSARLAGSALP